jgi:hypothetical protein
MLLKMGIEELTGQAQLTKNVTAHITSIPIKRRFLKNTSFGIRLADRKYSGRGNESSPATLKVPNA